MIFAQTADTVTLWWQSIAVPTGVVLAALIAGTVAVRTARKTPHEKLRELAEIRALLIANATHDMVIEVRKLDDSIRIEVDKIDRQSQAVGRGRSAVVDEWVRQRSPWFEVVAAFLQIVPFGLLLVADTDQAPGFLVMIASITLAFTMDVGVYLRSSTVGWRKWLLALAFVVWCLFAASQILVYVM